VPLPGVASSDFMTPIPSHIGSAANWKACSVRKRGSLSSFTYLDFPVESLSANSTYRPKAVLRHISMRAMKLTFAASGKLGANLMEPRTDCKERTNAIG
jgi:hypothetical protein